MDVENESFPQEHAGAERSAREEVDVLRRANKVHQYHRAGIKYVAVGFDSSRQSVVVVCPEAAV